MNSCIFLTIFIIICGSLLLLFSPLLSILILPDSHDYRHTPHPPSPHFTPANVNLSENQLQMWKDDGLIVLRNVIPENLMEKINIGAEDLEANDTVQCKIGYYNGPPTFHRYDHFCHWPDKVHDYFRDALYLSPLPHIAAQLMGNKPIRVFDTFTMGSKAETMLSKRWHSDYALFTGVNSCDNGLIMWMPMLYSSQKSANGMIFARGSHKAHLKAIEDGTWSSYSKSVSGLISLLGLYNTLGESHPLEAPSLDPGDVVVFSKCTIHSTSGVNTMKVPRHALQMRFFTDPQTLERGIQTPYPEMGDKFTNGSVFLSGSKYPRIWPKTLEEEDAVRASGHMILTKLEWITHLAKYPDHLLVSCVASWAEYFGVFQPEHPVFLVLTKMAETFGIL